MTIFKRHLRILAFTVSVLIAAISYMVALTLHPEKMEKELPPIIVAEDQIDESIISKRLNESFDSIMDDISHDGMNENAASLPENHITKVNERAEDLNQIQLIVDGEEYPEAEQLAPQTDIPRYVSNAEFVEPKAGYAQIALIIDDMGVKPQLSKRALTILPSAVTFAFLPYGKSTAELALKAREEQHEIMIHLPMEPLSPKDGKAPYPGKDALYVADDLEEIQVKTQKNLDALKNISVGVNNHMGSKFTGYEEGLRAVLPLVAKEKLMFLDSLTTAETKVKAAAKGLKLPLLKRHIFIDHYIEEDKIFAALTRLEKIAQKNGNAIGIGHPHSYTLDVLEKWLPTLEEKKIQLVPITALLPQ